MSERVAEIDRQIPPTIGRGAVRFSESEPARAFYNAKAPILGRLGDGCAAGVALADGGSTPGCVVVFDAAGSDDEVADLLLRRARSWLAETGSQATVERVEFSSKMPAVTVTAVTA